MRLKLQQRHLISQNVHCHLGENARMWLYGSRLSEQKRGGDLNLYVEVDPHTLMDELRCKMRLEEALDLSVDLVVRPSGDQSPLARIAKTEGVVL